MTDIYSSTGAAQYLPNNARLLMMKQVDGFVFVNDTCMLMGVCALTVLDVGGAEGLVSETISWMARRSLRRCRGLLMPISLWISVSDRADMIAPLFTLARQAATYHAGIPSHSFEHTHIVVRLNMYYKKNKVQRMTCAVSSKLHHKMAPLLYI